MKAKNVYIISGSNGSGKTTFARKFLPNYAKCPNFVNADLIAQGLSPFSPRQSAMKAGRLVLEQIKQLADKNVDFGFETTLSGRTYLRTFQFLKEKGYKLHLFFLWIPGSQLAIERIKDRVLEGGHHVPTQDVRRRFKRSIYNFFNLYEPLLDAWTIFNNSGPVPTLMAKRTNGKVLIIDEKLYNKIKEN